MTVSCRHHASWGELQYWLKGNVVNIAGTAAVCHAGVCGCPRAALAIRNGARLHSAPGVPQRCPRHRAAVAVSLRPGAGVDKCRPTLPESIYVCLNL